MLGKTHTLRCQLIEIRCFDFGLAVCADFIVAEVVGKNVDDIGALRRLIAGENKKAKKERQMSESHQIVSSL